MSKPFFIKTGDTAPAIQATLTDGNGDTIDLTGGTVVFNMADEDGVLVVDRGSVTVVSATAPATVKYEWQAADTATAGYYTAEFEVTYADGTIETFPNRGYLSVQISGDLE